MLRCGLWWGKTAQATPKKGVLASTFYLNRWGALRLPQSNYPIHKLGPRWLEEATAGDQAGASAPPADTPPWSAEWRETCGP